MIRSTSSRVLTLALASALSGLAWPVAADPAAAAAPASAASAAAPATPAAAAAPANAATPATPAAAPVANGPIDCIEVEMFKVTEDAPVAGQTARASEIPVHNLELIRDDMLRYLPKMNSGLTVLAAGTGACPNAQSAASVSGDILDFRKGNMALRYFVGFGAGSQKVRVRLTVTRKSGTVLGQSEIADTKWAGAFGGTNTKGLDDFAEKAAKAVTQTLKTR